MERQEPTVEAPSTAIDVGDVNVQFPDTLVGYSTTFVRFGANLCFSSGSDGVW